MPFSGERIEEDTVETGAKLFVFDPLQAYLDSVNMNNDNGILPLFERPGALANRTGYAFVIVRHHGKRRHVVSLA